MATQNSTLTEITVRISPVIEREFKRRGIFPELRLENAIRIQNGATGIHKVSGERASELIADAKAMQAHKRELPRGIPAAYSALARNIALDLKQEARRGVWEDPGYAAVAELFNHSPARLEVGDKVLYFSNDTTEYGDEVSIVGPYKMYAVSTENGAYIDSADKRRDYKFGYVVEMAGERFFAAAHTLSRMDCKPSHLRLAASRPVAAFC